MELSQFTDYSLRVLMYVGMTERGNRPLSSDQESAALPSVRAIAEAFHISQSHLVKVVHKLGQLGYIHTFRGRGGGITLAMPPEDIVVGKVVRQTENLAIVECLAPGATNATAGGGGCCIAPVCELKRVLARARDAFLTSLDSATVADLLEPHRSLVSLLQPSIDTVAAIK
ncbi:MAG: Rrf2 family nitric oxide-sensitive transcriptional repressor [Verrucomicrobiales bacterium]|jgi:Rrf2 family nitric oxide-sensitive transcriptional repressor